MTADGTARLGIIIPALDEAASLPGLLDDLARLAVPHEVIVADGGSTDGTDRIAERLGARLVRGSRGRGAQMDAGARESQAGVLCFLHADVRLDREATGALERVASGPLTSAYAFRLGIGARGLGYRIIELGANLRSVLLRLPYGDQGLIVAREVYTRAGGFRSIPLMEDVTLVRAIGRHARIRILREKIRVSSRRWEREGLFRRTALNWGLLGAWAVGVPPERLARWYRSKRHP